MKKKAGICLVILVWLLLCGCGSVPETPRADADTLNEPVLVSQFTNLAVDLSGAEMLWMDSTAVSYWKAEWNPGHQVTEASVFRTDFGNRRTVLCAEYGGEDLSVGFLMSDGHRNLYLWGCREKEEAYLLRKYDSRNDLLWETVVDLSRRESLIKWDLEVPGAYSMEKGINK